VEILPSVSSVLKNISSQIITGLYFNNVFYWPIETLESNSSSLFGIYCVLEPLFKKSAR